MNRQIEWKVRQMGETQFGPVDFSHFLESVSAAKDAVRHLISGMREPHNLEAAEAMLGILEANEAEFHAVVPGILKAEMETARENELELARLAARSRELDEELNRALAEAEAKMGSAPLGQKPDLPPLRPGMLAMGETPPELTPTNELVRELMEPGKEPVDARSAAVRNSPSLIWENFLPIAGKKRRY